MEKSSQKLSALILIVATMLLSACSGSSDTGSDTNVEVIDSEAWADPSVELALGDTAFLPFSSNSDSTIAVTVNEITQATDAELNELVELFEMKESDTRRLYFVRYTVENKSTDNVILPSGINLVSDARPGQLIPASRDKPFEACKSSTSEDLNTVDGCSGYFFSEDDSEGLRVTWNSAHPDYKDKPVWNLSKG